MDTVWYYLFVTGQFVNWFGADLKVTNWLFQALYIGAAANFRKRFSEEDITVVTIESFDPGLFGELSPLLQNIQNTNVRVVLLLQCASPTT